MKTLIPLLAIGTIFLSACSDEADNRPIPGTIYATSTKDPANENNTPRNNPTPNPDPDSQPPDQVTQRTVYVQPQ